MAERFGSRVTVGFEMDPATHDCAVPVLLLQPLLENAFRHGVEQTAGPAQVRLRAQAGGGRLRLTVQCDVGPLDTAAADGLGLANLRERLRLAHGDAARLSLSALPPAGTVAEVELPCAC